MMSSRLSRLALLAGLVCLALPAHADAQIGGFLKKKIKQAVKGDSTEAKASPSGPSFDNYVLQLSSQNLDRLEQALAGEKAFRDSALAAKAKQTTPQQYDQCRLKTMKSPEAQALIPPKDAAGFQKYNSDFEAIMQKRCGPNPNMFKELDLKPGAEIGARAAGLTRQQYAIMKERIAPFCKGGGAARVPGAMPGMDYVYAPDEIAALQPRCPKLMALLGKSFDTGTGDGPSVASGPKFDDKVIEMDPDDLNRLETYYVALDEYRPGAPARPAAKMTKKEWDQCAQQFIMSPEGRTFMQNAASDPQSMPAKMQAAVEKRCGPNPGEADQEALSGPDAAARAAGLSPGQIPMLLERLYPLCTMVKAQPNKPFSARMQRMYSPAELKALPTRCARLMPLIEKHLGAPPQQ